MIIRVSFWLFIGYCLTTTFGFAQQIKITQVHQIASSNCQQVSLDDIHTPPVQLKAVSQNQRGCLVAKINLKKTTAQLALTINMLASRKIYWNGELIGVDGILGNDKTSEIPGPIRNIHIIPAHLLHEGEHQINIDIANFHIKEPLSNLIYALHIQPIKPAMNYALKQSLLPIITFGILIFAGLFLQVIFFSFEKQLNFQVVSLMCFSSALLLLAEHYRTLFGYTYDWHVFRLHCVLALTIITMLSIALFHVLNMSYHGKFKLFAAYILLSLILISVLDERYDAKSFIMFACTLLFCMLLHLLAYRSNPPHRFWGAILYSSCFFIFILSPTGIAYLFIEQWFVVLQLIIISSIIATLIQQMQKQKKQALSSARLEIDLLKRNLHPHFLMNSLTLTTELIETEPEKAVQFVESIASELRHLVEYSSKKTIDIKDEIKLCQQHLTIMSYRYDANYQLIVSQGEIEVKIPPAVIHTQIENAFSHNRLSKNAQFHLTITQESEDKSQPNKNLLTIITLKSEFHHQKRKNNKLSTGTGEKYIHARLQESFANNYQYLSYADGEYWINQIKYWN